MSRCYTIAGTLPKPQLQTSKTKTQRHREIQIQSRRDCAGEEIRADRSMSAATFFVCLSLALSLSLSLSLALALSLSPSLSLSLARSLSLSLCLCLSLSLSLFFSFPDSQLQRFVIFPVHGSCRPPGCSRLRQDRRGRGRRDSAVSSPIHPPGAQRTTSDSVQAALGAWRRLGGKRFGYRVRAQGLEGVGCTTGRRTGLRGVFGVAAVTK